MARQKPQPKATASHSAPSLALSSLHLRREALENEHQWLLTQIKRKRTELNNFVTQMRSVATQIFGQCEPLYQQFSALDQEIHALFAEIFQTRKLGNKSRQNILEVYEMLQLIGTISPKLDEDEEDEDEELDDLFGTDEDEQRDRGPESYKESEMGDSSEGESAPKSSSRQIRRIFLRLAEVFHPDKVTDNETQMRHTEIMKELNRAYQDGDLARLLEIEKQHQAGEFCDLDSSSEDDLQRECDRLEKESQLLRTQYEQLKEELRLVRNTPEGAMVKDYRQAVREGINPVSAMLAEIKAQIKVLEKTRNFVRDFLQKKMTIKEFLRGPTSAKSPHSDEFESLLAQMLGLDSVSRF